eukprot:TRINITY_DN60798_c0_g1_i1.p1 TRINITY_DN60798_c0_g1~~TRINITY_DN60798_c0_g1_i1.p1  ORF type:complete len:484 (+),score=157.04 TRINITY_DN60798_c0_g1_i1:79-1452(+)
MPTHLQMRISALGAVVGVLMLGTMLLTYTLCVNQDHCPKLPALPTISDTWVYPPENYVSRFVVGNCCLLMALAQFAMYWIDAGGLSACFNKVLCTTGVASVFFLSIVGAVCDSPVPSCRGDNTVHTTAAVIFFIGYNLCMAAITLKKPAGAFEGALVGASLLTKARFLDVDLAGLTGLGDSSLAYVEWSDVAIIITWTVTYLCRHGSTYRGAFINSDAPGDDPTPLSFWTMLFGVGAMTVLYIGTLAATAAIYKAQGRWPAGGLPFISDTWVYPPGNWISRWSCVITATISMCVHLCVYYLETDGKTQGPKGAQARLYLALVAMLGISIVGCVDESENITVHTTAAGVFFGGYDAYMVLTVLGLLRDKGLFGLSAGLAAAVSVVSKARFVPAARGWLEGSWSDLPQILEWSNAIAFAVFFLALAASFGKARMEKIGLGIYSTSAAGAAKEVPLLPLP